MLISLSRVLGVSMEFLITGRITCQEDVRAFSDLSGEEKGNYITGDMFKFLSREDLLVLLTACLWEH